MVFHSNHSSISQLVGNDVRISHRDVQRRDPTDAQFQAIQHADSITVHWCPGNCLTHQNFATKSRSFSHVWRGRLCKSEPSKLRHKSSQSVLSSSLEPNDWHQRALENLEIRWSVLSRVVIRKQAILDTENNNCAGSGEVFQHGSTAAIEFDLLLTVAKLL